MSPSIKSAQRAITVPQRLTDSRRIVYGRRLCGGRRLVAVLCRLVVTHQVNNEQQTRGKLIGLSMIHIFSLFTVNLYHDTRHYLVEIIVLIFFGHPKKKNLYFENYKCCGILHCMYSEH